MTRMPMWTYTWASSNTFLFIFFFFLILFFGLNMASSFFSFSFFFFFLFSWTLPLPSSSSSSSFSFFFFFHFSFDFPIRLRPIRCSYFSEISPSVFRAMAALIKRGLRFCLKPRLKRGLRAVWGRVFSAAIGPGLGPRFKKCGLRPTGPIVTRFRPRNTTQPKKTRTKAKRA